MGAKRQSEANKGVDGRLGWWAGDDSVCQSVANAVRLLAYCMAVGVQARVAGWSVGYGLSVQ